MNLIPRTSFSLWWLLIPLALMTIVLVSRGNTGNGTAPQKALAELRLKIRQDYTDVVHISPAEVRQWQQQDVLPPIILDIREPEEYAVSHIAHAINIPPATPVQTAINAHLKHRQQGQKILVYCSVGVRSSRYAQQLQAAGVGEIYNLDGSLFAWANQGYPLVQDRGPANTVHGYDAQWQRYLLPRLRFSSEATQKE